MASTDNDLQVNLTKNHTNSLLPSSAAVAAADLILGALFRFLSMVLIGQLW